MILVSSSDSSYMNMKKTITCIIFHRVSGVYPLLYAIIVLYSYIRQFRRSSVTLLAHINKTTCGKSSISPPYRWTVNQDTFYEKNKNKTRTYSSHNMKQGRL